MLPAKAAALTRIVRFSARPPSWAPAPGGVGDGHSVGVADSQGLFHHDVHAEACAGFDDSAMIVRRRVDERGLRAGLLQHVVEAGVVDVGIETEQFRVSREKRLAGIGDTDDVDVSAVKILLEKSVDVAVNEADNNDAERRGSYFSRRHSQEEEHSDRESRERALQGGVTIRQDSAAPPRRASLSPSG